MRSAGEKRLEILRFVLIHRTPRLCVDVAATVAATTHDRPGAQTTASAGTAEVSSGPRSRQIRTFEKPLSALAGWQTGGGAEALDP
jgi:hypothetical protein